MAVQMHEEQNYTPEQVAGHLDDALAIMDATDIPNDLRPEAFVEVIRLLAAKRFMVMEHQGGAVDLSLAALRSGGPSS